MAEKVSPDEVRARWTYSELLSGRYNGVQGIESLLEKCRQRVPFAKLLPPEQDKLAQAWHEVRGALGAAFVALRRSTSRIGVSAI